MRTPLVLLVLGSAALAAPLRAEEPPAVPPEVSKAVADLASTDRDTRIAAAQQAAALQHETLIAPLVKALKDDYRSVRDAAVQALAARAEKGAKAKAAKALEGRLKEVEGKPDAAEEAALVVSALHDLAQPSSIEPLLKGLDPTTDLTVARARLNAVGNIPSLAAIEALINYAAKGRGGDGAHRGGALQALEYATGVKLASLDAWHIWWADNKKTFDVEAAARLRAEKRAEQDAKRAQKEAAKEKQKEQREKKEGAPKKEGEPAEPKSKES